MGAPVTSKNGARKAAFNSAVFFRVRLRARGRFLFFASFEALILKVRSPRGLKPRVAAGGREAIRIIFVRPRGAPGAFGETPGEAPGAHLAPKRAPEASRSHFGTIFGAKMEPRGFIFQAFLDTLGLYFGHLRPLLSQASRLCWCLAFAFGCSPSVSFRPVLSARWPVLGRMPQ